MSLDVTLYNDPCPHCGISNDEVYWANITHNLTDMANEAGIYGIVWRPEENSISRAKWLIEPLEKAIKEMKEDPERFKKHNSPNGWGTYKCFLPWLERYLRACRDYPNASVYVSR